MLARACLLHKKLINPKTGTWLKHIKHVCEQTMRENEMKTLPVKPLAVSICIICVLSIGFVSALEANEASVSLFWSSQKIYQSDVISVKITFLSNCSDQLTIVGIGLQFDWAPDMFYGHDFSDNPVIIPAYGSHIFDAINIQIPANASTGTHNYFVGVDGVQGYSLTEFSWDSPTMTMQVNSITGKIYAVLVSQFESSLDEAINANYQSAEAQSLLQQAQEEYDLSYSLVSGPSVTDEQWSQALTHVQAAITHLGQASEAEQNTQQASEQQTLLLYLAIAAIAVIIVLSIIIIIIRKRRKQPEPEVEQEFDQSLETEDYTPEE
jgi:hypothetical protein